MFAWSEIPLTWGFVNDDTYKVPQYLFTVPQFWFTIMLTLVICMVPEILWLFQRRLWNPTREDVVEELDYIQRNFDFSTKSCVDVREMRREFIEHLTDGQKVDIHAKSGKLGQSANGAARESKEMMRRELTPSETEKTPLASSEAQSARFNNSKSNIIAGEAGAAAVGTANDNELHSPLYLQSPQSQTMPSGRRQKSLISGYSDFHQDPDDVSYIMSQEEYLRSAMIKKQFSRRLTVDESEDLSLAEAQRRRSDYHRISAATRESMSAGDPMVGIGYQNSPGLLDSGVRIAQNDGFPVSEEEEESEMHPL